MGQCPSPEFCQKVVDWRELTSESEYKSLHTFRDALKYSMHFSLKSIHSTKVGDGCALL